MNGGEKMNVETTIHGGEIILTNDNDSIYEIKSGEALIYIVPAEEDNKTGRRLFIYEANQGEVIPALNYTDFEGLNWKFAIAAVDKAIITECRTDETEMYKSEFAQKIKLKNYEIEGFEEGIAEWYRLQIIKEDGFIHKTGQEQKHTYEKGLNLIYGLFNSIPKKIENKTKNNIKYDAISFLCRASKINIASFDKIKESCGDDITVENIARISHFITRKIVLEENWFKKDLGPILVYSKDEENIYACIPTKSGYMRFDPTTEKREVVTFEKAQEMSFRGYMCYRPFENKKLTMRELIKFGFESINKRDSIRLYTMTILGSLIGLLIPTLNQQLYDTYIPVGASNALIQMCMVIFAFMLGNVTFSIVKNLSGFRITSRIKYNVHQPDHHAARHLHAGKLFQKI